MKNKIVAITDPLSDVPVMRDDINNLSEATEALDAIATVLRYVGIQTQGAGDEGESAGQAALGLASAVEIAVAQIEQFQDRQLKVRAGGK